MQLILLNPNTSAAITAQMVRIAQDQAGALARIEGRTAPFGAPLITSPATLDQAEQAVGSMTASLAGAGGVIVAAFGDPGLGLLRTRLGCAVTGIAEAGMAEAATGGRRFAVVTTTPDLRDRIAQTAARHGHAGFVGTWVTPGDPGHLMSDPEGLVAALHAACRAAIRDGGAQALVIGGGPLAMAARALAGCLPVPLIEPVPAAVRLALARGRPTG
jgi:allantoin racemase